MRGSLLVVGLLAVALTGCSSSDDTVRIGVLSDCQGPFEAFEDGQLSGAVLPFLRRGAKLVGTAPSDGVTAIEVGGRRVELLHGCQETGEHTVYIEDARRLVEREDVDLVVGGASVVARDVARRYPEVPFLSAFWDDAEITLRQRAPNLFRFSPDFAQQAAGLGTYAFRDLGWRRAAVVAGDGTSGWAGAAAFTAEFCALGGTVVETAYRSPWTGRPDVRARALGAAPDGVAAFLDLFDDPAGTLLPLARALGTPSSRLLIWSRNLDDPALVEALGPVLDDVVSTSWLPAGPPSEVLREYRRSYRAAFPGLPPFFADQPWILSYYDAVEAALRALEQVGSGDVREGLLRELGRLELELPGGSVGLDGNGQAVRDGYLARLAFAAGKTTLEPVRVVPGVEQTFAGLLSEAPPPGPIIDEFETFSWFQSTGAPVESMFLVQHHGWKRLSLALHLNGSLCSFRLGIDYPFASTKQIMLGLRNGILWFQRLIDFWNRSSRSMLNPSHSEKSSRKASWMGWDGIL